MEEMKETGAVLEFQLTSNVRLNNLSSVSKHPLKKYLRNNVKCVQGTDGCGFYGTDTFDEQLALFNLLGLDDDDFEKMRKVEDEIIEERKQYFKEKRKKFKEFLNGRTITEAITDLEKENFKKSKNNVIPMRISNKVEVDEILKYKVKDFPIEKTPIVIAGGSFNAKNRETLVDREGLRAITKILKKLDDNKVYFVIGHKITGYEKAIIEVSKKLNKKFEVYAIVPKETYKEELENLKKDFIKGVRISIEREEMGLYKSFNYEIFERRNSIVLAFDGNSPVSNLIQEAKNGKGSSKIYVNSEVEALNDKAITLGGYVKDFKSKTKFVDEFLKDNPELLK